MSGRGQEKRQRRRAERAVQRMAPIERQVFLSIRIGDASYAEVAVAWI
jgi:DNA-directed RNA polymerase specialized sigma24 family protein